MFRSPLTWKIFFVTLFLLIISLLLPLIFAVHGFEKLIINYAQYETQLEVLYSELEALKSQITLITLTVLIVTILGSFVLFELIISPLLKIVKGTEEILRGNSKKQLDITSGDELQILAGNLNKMNKKFSDVLEREKTISQMKSDFVSLAAHQMRTPISAIKWALHSMLHDEVGPISEEQRALLRRTAEKSEVMINVIKDLMDVMRLEEGKYPYEPREERLEPLIQQVFQEKISRAKLNDVIFDLKRPSSLLPLLLIDAQSIKTALDNVIDNALDYTPPKGKVTIDLMQEQNNVIITVSDNGIGMPQNEIPRIFDKFFRGTLAIRMQTEGNGMGLYIAKNIIERHGGKITVRSKTDQGSTFYITLPIPEKFLQPKQYKKFIEEL